MIFFLKFINYLREKGLCKHPKYFIQAKCFLCKQLRKKLFTQAHFVDYTSH